jgi:hypothetical protein
MSNINHLNKTKGFRVKVSKKLPKDSEGFDGEIRVIVRDGVWLYFKYGHSWYKASSQSTKVSGRGGNTPITMSGVSGNTATQINSRNNQLEMSDNINLGTNAMSFNGRGKGIKFEDSTTARVDVANTKIGTLGRMVLTDNQLDVSSGDLTIQTGSGGAGNIILDAYGGSVTIKDPTPADLSPTFILQSDHNGALGPQWYTLFDSDSPAVTDYIFFDSHVGKNDADELVTYVYKYAQILNVEDGDECSNFYTLIMANGTSRNLITGTGTVGDLVNVSIGYGATSTATIAGNLDIDGAKITSVGALEIDPGGALSVTGQDLIIDAAKYLRLDGSASGNTYIYEATADTVRHVVGGTNVMVLSDNGGDGNEVAFGGCAGFTQLEPSYDAVATIVDFRKSNKQNVTFGAGNIGHVIFYFPEVSGNFQLLLKQDGTGSRTITGLYKVYAFDETIAEGEGQVKWAGGSAPTLTTDANHVDILSFYWDAENEIVYGVATLDFQF